MIWDNIPGVYQMDKRMETKIEKDKNIELLVFL
jgi:hypothetical protein